MLGSRLSVVSCDASTWRKRNCNACQRSFLGPQRANALGSDWSDQSLPYGGGPVTSLVQAPPHPSPGRRPAHPTPHPTPPPAVAPPTPPHANPSPSPGRWPPHPTPPPRATAPLPLPTIPNPTNCNYYLSHTESDRLRLVVNIRFAEFFRTGGAYAVPWSDWSSSPPP